jgi:FkbM family methyltransferase
MASASAILRRYARLTRRYWREAATPRDFLDVMKVRLALSKLGRIACPEPVVLEPRLRSLGGRVRLRSHSTDISVLGELVVGDGYAAVPAALPRPPRTIVDLGANTGLAARWFLTLWPDARVVAVEPEPGNLEVLRPNLEGAGARAGQLTVVPAAVGARERTAVLHTTSGEYGFTMVGEPAGDTGIDVPVVTMSTVLDACGFETIDLLKADIEGAERELFADCAGWIGLVQAMVVECHGDYTVDDLVADVARAGVAFDVVEHERKPAFGFEVGVLVRA